MGNSRGCAASRRSITFAALILALAVVRVAGQAPAQSFQSCVAAAAPTVILRTSASSDFGLLSSRGIYTSPTPTYIASVFSTANVVAVIRCAAAAGLQVCPRAGGHSFTGQSTCRDVLVDVRNLNTLFYNDATQRVTVGLGNTGGELFYTAVTASRGARMVPVGLCPSVGTGGYLPGGGHNPYSGITGLTCELMDSLELVTGIGEVVTASRTNNTDLFWASCGGGGGHFGIATRAVLNTWNAAVFNNNVYFRYTWPRSVVGTLMSQWLDYNQENGRTWFRLEIRAGEPLVYGYGACWDASTTAACTARLSTASFFNLPGRVTRLLVKSNRVAEFQAFIGPYGNWGNNTATISDAQALVNRTYLEAGIGVHRVYSSGFFKFPPGDKPSVATLQAAADVCFDVDRSVVSYLMCIYNPWDGLEKTAQVPSAFAHHDMNMFTEYVGDFAQETNTAGKTALEDASNQFRQLLRPYFAGLYVNYPEPGLSDKDYGYLYWGKGYQRLANIRSTLDPRNLMAQVQGLPRGTIPCQYRLRVTSPTATTRLVQIDGYDMGQLIGMQATWTMSAGCSITASATSGARVTSSGGSWTAEVFNDQPFRITVTRGTGSGGPASCTLNTVDINGISCPGVARV